MALGAPPTDGPTEESAIALVEDLLAVKWDEQGLGIGHNDEFFSSVSEDPILTRITDGTSDRALAGNYLQGTVDETFISVSVAGTTASVVYCAIDNLTGFRSDGSVFLPPLDTPILSDYQLRFDDLDGWKMTTFFVGEACQL